MMERTRSSPRVTNRRSHYLFLTDSGPISLAENGGPEAFAALYDRHSRPASVSGLPKIPLGTVEDGIRLVRNEAGVTGGETISDVARGE
jgi:hypothetical protein